MLKKRTLALCAGLLLAGVTGRGAEAAPILGAQLIYTGGLVTATTLFADSSFVSELGLYDSTFTRLLFLVNDEPPAESITFDPVALGIAVGDELILGIRVVSDANHEYFLGLAARNPDAVVHGAIDTAGGDVIVSFEDWFDGGDLDYNDAKFRIEGGVRLVPAPGEFVLLSLGVGGLLMRRRRT